MDRLLQFLLLTFIRRRTFRLTNSRVTQIVFGDGTANSSRFALPPAPPNGASCSIPSCGLAKPTWTAALWSSKARSAMYWPSCSGRTAQAICRIGKIASIVCGSTRYFLRTDELRTLSFH